jgi:uncharacterized phiE125 gp8 family phage protein
MNYEVTTAPTHFPPSLAEIKRHLRVTGTDSDTLISTMTAAAFRWCQQYENKSWLYQTLTIKLDRFVDTMILPAPPLIGVDSISYLDINGDAQTLAAAGYDVDTTSVPGRVTLAYNQSWPSTRNQHHAVTITATAGHVATFTADASTDAITVAGHLLQTGDLVHVYTSAADLPGGLSAATDYYILAQGDGTYKLSTTEGGAAADITDAGTGTHYIDALGRHQIAAVLMLVCDMYDHRRSVIEGTYTTLPHAVRNLLGPGRMAHV